MPVFSASRSRLRCNEFLNSSIRRPSETRRSSTSQMCSQYSSNKMILNFTNYDVRVHNVVDVMYCQAIFERRTPWLNLYKAFRGSVREGEKSKRSRTSTPKDLAIRSRAAGLGQPWPNSREAIRRALRRTLAEYSSRLIPEKSRNSLIRDPS